MKKATFFFHSGILRPGDRLLSFALKLGNLQLFFTVRLKMTTYFFSLNVTRKKKSQIQGCPQNSCLSLSENIF